MKLKKRHLQKESYDFHNIDDEVFVIDHANKSYKKMNDDLLELVNSGEYKL
jgi:hypothetical protein